MAKPIVPHSSSSAVTPHFLEGRHLRQGELMAWISSHLCIGYYPPCTGGFSLPFISGSSTYHACHGTCLAGIAKPLLGKHKHCRAEAICPSQQLMLIHGFMPVPGPSLLLGLLPAGVACLCLASSLRFFWRNARNAVAARIYALASCRYLSAIFLYLAISSYYTSRTTT